ncbi:MAG: CRISPR-associated endonuclease Cas6 [Candidatus Brocadia sp.]
MIVFRVHSSVNFEIPDYWGIGKSVSRGFGTVVRQKTDDRSPTPDVKKQITVSIQAR